MAVNDSSNVSFVVADRKELTVLHDAVGSNVFPNSKAVFKAVNATIVIKLDGVDCLVCSVGSNSHSWFS